MDSWNNHHVSLQVSDFLKGLPCAPSPTPHPPLASHSIHSPVGTNSYFPLPCWPVSSLPPLRGFYSPLHLSPSCSSIGTGSSSSISGFFPLPSPWPGSLLLQPAYLASKEHLQMCPGGYAAAIHSCVLYPKDPFFILLHPVVETQSPGDTQAL